MCYRKMIANVCNFMACLLLFIFLSSCTIGNGKPLSWGLPPAYTPIISISEGTKLPSEAKYVSIENITEQPKQFEGQFIEVRGLTTGPIPIPACSPYYGPTDDWGLQAGPYISYPGGAAGYEPPLIQVTNIFKNVVNDWETVDFQLGKKAAVWGWWRLYDGPFGCGQVDPQGNPLPPPLVPGEQHWYLDAAKLQWLERIEAPTPIK